MNSIRYLKNNIEDKKFITQGEITMDTLNTVLNTLTTYVKIAGGLACVWGAVTLGTNLNDHNGPGIQQGIWRMVGGGVIIAAAMLFGNIAK